MNALKRLSGFIWIILGLVAIYLMFKQAGAEIAEARAGIRPLLDTQMFWYVIIPIFTPIMLGLCLFGWFAWKGEYDVIARDSEHLT
ncbi:MAG: hypothetical protein JNJ90_14210 [Saprospiraceae bacterium]|jgi:uncharacterized membrane protein|nr:hypothetical protein [Saprospiraceae bacterium]